MFASNSCSQYFIVKKQAAGQAPPDLVLSGEGVAHVTAEDLDFSGRVFRVLGSPFQKSCFACACSEPDQVPDVLRVLRKAYPALTQLIFPKVRSGRKVVSDYGSLKNKAVFWGFLAAMEIPLERFILDPACLIIIDGADDILGDMIKNGLFDIDNVEVLENLTDPELVEKYVTE